jgi:hypothetical protein
MAFLEQHAEYVVLWVTLVVWAGVAALLVWVEQRLQRVEQWVERNSGAERFSDVRRG